MVTTDLLNKLHADYPQFEFRADTCPHWSSKSDIIYYDPSDIATLFHELGHAINHHKDFTLDTELIAMERQAWTTGSLLASKYSIIIPEYTIEESLDSYRDWLHKRSLCPECNQTGCQHADGIYSCFNCLARWRVNDGRTEQCRRRKL